MRHIFKLQFLFSLQSRRQRIWSSTWAFGKPLQVTLGSFLSILYMRFCSPDNQLPVYNNARRPLFRTKRNPIRRICQQSLDFVWWRDGKHSGPPAGGCDSPVWRRVMQPVKNKKKKHQSGDSSWVADEQQPLCPKTLRLWRKSCSSSRKSAISVFMKSSVRIFHVDVRLLKPIVFNLHYPSFHTSEQIKVYLLPNLTGLSG